MELFVAAAVVVLALGFIVVWARRTRATLKAEQRAALEVLDGREVILGIGSRFVVPQTGTLRVGDDRFSVTLVGTSSRAVPLADIRWVSDPETGRVVGGPW